MDSNYVISLSCVVFVMYVQFSCMFDEFIIYWVFYVMCDSNSERFIYFVVDYMVLKSMDFIVYY